MRESIDGKVLGNNRRIGGFWLNRTSRILDEVKPG